MTVKTDDAVVNGVFRPVAVARSENDDDSDNLKPLLDDTANDNNNDNDNDNDNDDSNNNTGINNTLSTIGTILSSTNSNILNSNNITDGKNSKGNANNNNNVNAIMYLRIKSSYGDTEIEIPKRGCPRTTTVAQLKAVVRIVLLEKERKGEKGNLNDDNSNNNEDRYLRLICKGRLLSPDESLLSEFKVYDNDVVHVVLAASSSSSNRNKQQRKKNSATTTTTTTTSHHQQQQRRRHTNHRQRHNRGTVVGPGGRVTRVSTNNNEGDDDDSNSDDEYDDIERGGGSRRERRGFDRLRTAGLSRPEITAIRTYFNRHVDRYIEQQQRQQHQQHDNNNSNDIRGAGEGDTATTAAVGTTVASSRLHLDEPDLRRRRLLIEENWMTTQGPGSEFRLNLNQNTISRVAALSAEIGTGNGGLLRNTNTGSSGQRQQQNGSMGNDRDFIWGFCLGFFVGIIGLLWIWIPSVPQKQKIGILTGICFQFFLNKDNIMDGETKYDNNEMVFENTYVDGD